MSHLIVLAAGGTGGHLFPAQATAQALQEKLGCDILFMAKGLSTNARFAKAFTSIDIHAAGIGFRGCMDIPRGVLQSIRHFVKRRPKAVIGFGSFHTFPVLLAATLLGIPVILHEANRIPGRVNRLLARFAAFTGVFFPDTKLSGTVLHTDIPRRKEQQRVPSKDEVLNHYGLQHDGITVLVFGGSLGAKKLNALASEALSYIGKNTKLQVLHFTGNEACKAQVEALYAQNGIQCVVKEFEHEMAYAWSAADLVISRAGASTVSEQIAFAVPSILIPFPFAADRHQDANAQFVEEVVRGGVVCFEDGLTRELLQQQIQSMLCAIEKYRQNLIEYQKKMASQTFVDHIITYLGAA